MVTKVDNELNHLGQVPLHTRGSARSEDDELVEVTPNSLRIRKKLLTETERKRAGR